MNTASAGGFHLPRRDFDAYRVGEDAAAPVIVAEWIKGLDASAYRDWATGFDDLVAAAKPAWPAKKLAADDKHVLKDIAAVADGADAEGARIAARLRSHAAFHLPEDPARPVIMAATGCGISPFP